LLPDFLSFGTVCGFVVSHEGIKCAKVDFLAKNQNKYKYKGLRIALNIQFKVKTQDALDKQWGKQALCIRII
jgi:hypothetical protein